MNTGNNPDALYSISDVSKKTHIKPTVLRFWESEFNELHPVKNKFGHRVYQESDISVILQIKKLLYEEGLTIKGAKNVLKNQGRSALSAGTASYTGIKDKLLDLLSLVRKRPRGS